MSFKFYLPSFDEMSKTSEGLAMIEIINDDSFRSALITGCPGSGKTTVSIYRLIKKAGQKQKVRLLTYQKLLVSLIHNLLENDLLKNRNLPKVQTFHKWQFIITGKFFEENNQIPTRDEFRERIDKAGIIKKGLHGELIIDEGQDLPLVVYEVLSDYFSPVFVGADEAQKIHNKGASPEQIQNVLKSFYKEFKPFNLGRNWRNTYETYAFARQFFDKSNLEVWNRDILDYLDRLGRHGQKPVIINLDTIETLTQFLKQIIENEDGSIGILCSDIKKVEDTFSLIEEFSEEICKYHSKIDIDADSFILKRCIVTTYKSSKGLEFDTVILPEINNPHFQKKDVRSQLYVACTRARGKLFVCRDLQKAATDPILHFQFSSSTYDLADSLQGDKELF
jgi:superfamily I DNA/RNA helicase